MIDHKFTAPYSKLDNNYDLKSAAMGDSNYIALEEKIDRLVDLCEAVQKENHQLKAFQNEWLQERAILKEKNEHIRQRVEAMIVRLKTLEQDA